MPAFVTLVSARKKKWCSFHETEQKL